MSPRVFLSLYIVLISFVIYNSAADSDVSGVRVEDALSGTSAAAKAVGKIIGSLFVNRATNCLIEAAVECKDFWKNPTAAVNCAKQYLAKNNGRCLEG